VSLSNVVNGVTCGAPGEVLLVGFGGLKQRLVKGAWVDEFDKDPTGDLHGSWGDGQGAFWAAGGDFVSKPVAEQGAAGHPGALGHEADGDDHAVARPPRPASIAVASASRRGKTVLSSGVLGVFACSASWLAAANQRAGGGV
jgi:hypothetical protein